MTNATNIASYGETDDSAAIMGNASYSTPPYAYIRQVSYKALPSGQINNPLTAASSNSYGSCNLNPCPYSLQFGDESISGTTFLYVGVDTPR